MSFWRTRPQTVPRMITTLQILVSGARARSTGRHGLLLCKFLANKCVFVRVVPYLLSNIIVPGQDKLLDYELANINQVGMVAGFQIFRELGIGETSR